MEDTIAEMRAQTSVPPLGQDMYSITKPIMPLSPEATAVIQDLESPRAVQELRHELTDVKSELQRLTEEVY